MTEELLDNILIVDDLPDNLRILTQMLTGKGYKVRKAINGETALLACESSPPDLILLDIKMPDLDGYQVCTILKDNPMTKDIPVIFISALSDTFDKVKAFEVGGIDYITKPFQLEEVLARIESQLTIQRQQKRLQEEIEKRKETEEILYQSRALLSSILNGCLDGIAALQAVREVTGEIKDFRCLVVNPIISQSLGIKKDDLIGKTRLKRILEKIDFSLFDLFVEVVNTGKVLKKEVYYPHEEKESYYQVTAVKLADGFAITVRDITQPKKLELELSEANKKLSYLVNIDGLTQINNRYSFDQYLKQELKRCTREKQYLSLILCDTDYFKKFNDHYGHLIGDYCLKETATILSKAVNRPGDFVARYGGEEFALILPNTTQEGALNIVESIQSLLQESHIPHEKSEISDYVTLSFGIVSVIPSADFLPANLIDLADMALYEAKKQGRNRAVLASSLMNSPEPPETVESQVS